MINNLMTAINQSIKDYKESGGENKNAFSILVQNKDGNLTAKCNFSENLNFAILYWENTDNKSVAKLFDCDEDAIFNLACVIEEHKLFTEKGAA